MKALSILFLPILAIVVSPGAHGSQSSPGCDEVPEIKSSLDSYRGDGKLLKEAKSLLDAVLRIDANCAPAYMELARFHIMDGHIHSNIIRPESLALAERSLNDAVAVDPDYADAYVLFGHLYRLMGRHKDAVESLEKAKLIGTGNPWLWLNWADLMIDERRYDLAAQYYQQVIDSKTTNSKAMLAAYEGLITYYEDTGALSNADIMHLDAIQYEPDNAWLYGNYASFLLYKVGDYDKAIQYGRMALERMDYGVGRQTLAAALYRKWAQYLVVENDRGAGQEYFDEAYRLYPNVRKIAEYANYSPHLQPTLVAFRMSNLIPSEGKDGGR